MTSPHGDVFRASLKRCLAMPDLAAPSFPAEVESAWRAVLGPGVEHLRSAY